MKKTIDRLELEKSELKEIISRKENPGIRILKEETELEEIRQVLIY